jgi:hypothetical protein
VIDIEATYDELLVCYETADSVSLKKLLHSPSNALIFQLGLLLLLFLIVWVVMSCHKVVTPAGERQEVSFKNSRAPKPAEFLSFCFRAFLPTYGKKAPNFFKLLKFFSLYNLKGLLSLVKLLGLAHVVK